MLKKVLEDPSLLIALGSLIIAVASAWYSRVGVRLAKKGLEISENQEARRIPNLVLYYLEGYRVKESDSVIYAFCFSIANPTDSDNAITYSELNVKCGNKEGLVVSVKVRHDENSAKNDTDKEINIIKLPAKIGAHDTMAGWFFFKIKKDTLGDLSILTRSVQFTDTHSKVYEYQILNIQDISTT